jgi:hypothetical protein
MIMRNFVLFCASLFTMVLLMSATPVRAQLWVSPTGSDSNACTEISPCLTFQGAVNKGSVSQINCLSSGSYGTVSITTSLTIDCGTGNVGNIISPSNAITISGAGVMVVLRHLSVNGLGSAQNGIITSGSFNGSVIIEDCTVQRYTGAGIGLVPNTGRGLLQISNSQVINNSFGITVAPSNGQIASVALNRVEVSANANDGLSLIGGGIVAGTMRDSLVASNNADGIQTSATQVFFTIEESSIIANLANGIHAGSALSNLNVTASTISGNGTGITATQGSIVSFGNNTLNGNASNGSFTSTVALQ